jgi:hypothetical protein
MTVFASARTALSAASPLEAGLHVEPAPEFP